MYSDPPPPSQFRRPWSPDPQAGNRTNYSQQHFDYDYDERHDSYMNSYDQTYPRTRREASDHSVEALDLADYAAAMRPSHRYPTQAVYPPSPSFQPPPSLVSRGNTVSTSSVASSSRRPFSLPPPATNARRGHPPISEVDIAQFPPWSQGWYQGNTQSSADVPAFLSNDSIPKHFDPGYTRTAPGASFERNGDHYPTLGLGSSPQSHSNRDSYGNAAPWSPHEQDPPSYHGHSSYHGGLDNETKEARMRLLEKEFGQNAPSGKAQDNDFLDENGNPLVGTVDQRGHLVTQGPKKRMATRVLQILFALTAAIPSIYAALTIKPDPAPPPAMSPGAIVLYVASVITSLVLLYMFAFRPCCCSGRRKSKGLDAANPLMNGMMVLPVSGMPGQKNKYRGGGKYKKGKRGMIGQPGGDVQVNLIVDPAMFKNRDESDSDDEDEERARGYHESGNDDHRSMPGGGYFGDPGGGGNGRKRNKKAKRRSIFAGLAMEAEWKRARSWAKKVAAADVFFTIAWGAVFVMILLGERCPTGGFEGWCNAFNVSTAAACLLCVAFGVSIFFDVKDLNTSKVSPRTRA